jgi:hypothetical protein
LHSVHGYSLGPGHPWCPPGTPPIRMILVLWSRTHRHRDAARSEFEGHRVRCARCARAVDDGAILRHVSGTRRICAEPPRFIEAMWHGECLITYDHAVRRFLPTPQGWLAVWPRFEADLVPVAG